MCTFCALGQYTANPTSTACNLCPQGKQTTSTGSTEQSACKKSAVSDETIMRQELGWQELRTPLIACCCLVVLQW